MALLEKIKYWLNKLISKRFWANILTLGILSIVIIFSILAFLKIYTQHGVTVKVPSLVGKTVTQVEEMLKNEPFRFEVSDSTYVTGKQPGEVIVQNPIPESDVKRNRKIYLTINSTNAPLTKLPDLMDASLRNAREQLGSRGLLLGNIEEIPGIGKVVKKMKVNGEEMLPSEPIAKGSMVDLVMTDGLGQRLIEVPYLIGKTYNEAVSILRFNELAVGGVIKDPDVQDIDASYVYDQRPVTYPNSGVTIRVGSTVDIYLQTEEIFPELMDENDNLLNSESDRIFLGNPNGNGGQPPTQGEQTNDNQPQGQNDSPFKRKSRP